MTATESIALLTPEPEMLAREVAAFEGIKSVRCKEPGGYKRMIDEGWITAKVVSVGGEPRYLIGYHLTDDGGLWVDINKTLHNSGTFHDLLGGVEIVARQNRCSYVRFATNRRGVVKCAEHGGFCVDAVLMTKDLSYG